MSKWRTENLGRISNQKAQRIYKFECSFWKNPEKECILQNDNGYFSIKSLHPNYLLKIT